MKLERRLGIGGTVLCLALAGPAAASPSSEDRVLIEALQQRVEALEAQVTRLTELLAQRADGEIATIEDRGDAPETLDASSAPPLAQPPEAPVNVPGILATAGEKLRLYGYFSTRYEKVFSFPSVDQGRVVTRDEPGEWSTPFFHLMVQSEPTERLRLFVNINGAGGDELALANFWGEYRFRENLSLRLGKTYRRFGLYNEILDAVPSYAGVEPPELFDRDHLLLSRTTVAMVHGRKRFGGGTLEASATTGNGEGARIADTVPIGFDVNYTFGPDDRFRLGVSGYRTNGRTGPDTAPGSGPSESGVLPWMDSDRFSVLGGYFESQVAGLTLQGAYWRSPHRARRNPAAVLQLFDEAGLSPFQEARFLLDPAGPRVADNVVIEADYDIETWYLRAAYAVSTRYGELVPYAFWDWYRNPETIANKAYGGDNEAGLADDGAFHKPTLGLVYRPVPSVAIKLDGSSHRFRLNGRNVSFPELRLDVSFVFGQ